MPVTNFDYRGMSSLPDVASVLGINNLNNINSLLDEDDYPLPAHRPANSIDRNSLLLIERSDDQFPTHLRRTGENSKNPNPNVQGSGPLNPSDNNAVWSNFSRHHKGNK